MVWWLFANHLSTVGAPVDCAALALVRATDVLHAGAARRNSVSGGRYFPLCEVVGGRAGCELRRHWWCAARVTGHAGVSVRPVAEHFRYGHDAERVAVLLCMVASRTKFGPAQRDCH